MLQWFAIALLLSCSCKMSHAGRLAEGLVNVQAQHMQNNPVTPKYATLVKMTAAQKVEAMKSWTQQERAAVTEKLKQMESWQIEKVEMLSSNADWHTGLKLKTNNKDNPYLFYHVSADVIITSYSGDMAKKYDNVVASVDGEPMPKGLTLGKLVDCVDGAKLLTKDELNGRCLIFTLRVMRSALGDCGCSGCGVGVPNSIEEVGKITKPEAEKRRIVYEGAVNKFILVLDHIGSKQNQFGGSNVKEMVNKAIEAVRLFTNVWPKETANPWLQKDAPADHNNDLVIPANLRK